ncbi:hypothetical protein HU200_022588 [Digitaria exilis]|uniref:Uncharacterized protein n=1 Tax=Digitaria exilis TaxID=1010633 RepID=A0A835C1D0_9POAL|nr:hypothetical protein HU200_022588 [Digitaria exilis]
MEARARPPLATSTWSRAYVAMLIKSLSLSHSQSQVILHAFLQVRAQKARRTRAMAPLFCSQIDLTFTSNGRSSPASCGGGAMAAPVEVGAQGTVGSLVLREVEYFQRMDGASSGYGKKSSSKVAASSGSPRSSSGKKQNKKTTTKVGGGNGSSPSFLPRMCSSAEVADSPSGGRRERPARVRYRPLGEEGDALHQED